MRAGELGVRAAGIVTEELLWRNQGEVVYTGTRLADGLPVTAKVYRRELYEQAPGRFDYECAALSAADEDGRAPPFTPLLGRVEGEAFRALIFARPAGVPLLEAGLGPGAASGAGKGTDTGRVLAVACQAAAALAALHRRRLTHRHVRPRAFTFDAQSGRLVLTDLGFSLGQDRAARDLASPSLLQETLPYVSPEQTGRVARGLDRRSDLYSFGAVLYELALGRPPFAGRDALELLHAHLAQEPVPLRALRRDLSPILSDIIDRLLAKDPAERYQSAEGLLADLERCRAASEGGGVPRFELGAEDHAEGFEFPDRLYGRDAEVAALDAALAAAREGRPSVLLISGPPGIGKTTLVERLRSRLAEAGGQLAIGKADLTRTATPYVAWAQAIAALADALSARPSADLALLRQRLLGSLEGLGAVLFELAPAVRDLLGEQPPPPAVGSLEAPHRLELALCRFVGALAAAGQPLLLFIDDLQWADPASLALWERLAQQMAEQSAQQTNQQTAAPRAAPSAGLVLVGAYRSGELPAAHPLRALGERLAARGVPVQQLVLGGIPAAAASRLIMDALHVGRERAEALAHALARRTDHNPLVMRRMLELLAERGVLTREGRGWTWSADRLLDVGLPESLIDVIDARIDRLAPEVKAALLAASCLGGSFDAESLAAALDRTPVETVGCLAELREQGLLVEAGGSYCFAHDGVLEAASRRLEEGERDEYHVRAGRFRRARADGAALQGEVLTIVGHLNRSIPSEERPEVLLDLAELNLLAGAKAVRGAAYGSAIESLQAGLRAIERWASRAGTGDPLLSSRLELELARATAFAADYASASRRFDELLARPLPALRLAEICSARVEVATAAGEFEDAVRWGLAGLAHTGLVLPRRPSRAALLREMLRMSWLSRGDVGRRIRALPRCEDPHVRIRIELLSILTIAVIRLGGELAPLVFLAGARETFRCGLTPAAPHALTSFGTLLVGVFGRLRAAADVADAALELAAAPDTLHRPKVTLASYSMLLPWTRPFEACVEQLGGVFSLASLEGDVTFAGYGLVFVANCQLAMGVPVEQLRRSAERARGYLARTAPPSVTAGQDVLLGIADWLSGAAARSLEADDPFGALANPDLSVRCPSIVFTSALHCVAGQPERALKLLEAIEPIAQHTLLAVAERGEYFFWRAFAAALAAERSGPGRGLQRRRLQQGRLHFQRWARLCPENFQSKALLLEAEWTRLSRSVEQASPLYQRAAELAERHGRLHVAALAHERLARLSVGSAASQERAVRAAVAAYSAWGATHKAALLAAEFRAALEPRPGAAAELLPSSLPPFASQVDWMSVLKTTRALTAAPDYESVAEQLMAGVMENVGAQRGVLVLQSGAASNGAWLVELACDVSGPERAARGVPLAAAHELAPVALLQLVQRTRSPVIHADAREAAALARDPYVLRRRVRAAMCVPIELQGRCIGAIYLENNLSPGVFTPERAEIVVALAAQAAISLTSARLFGALRSSEAEWRSLVDHAPDLIMIVGRDHRVEFLNHAPEGMQAERLRGAPVESFLSARGGACLSEAIDDVFARGGHQSCDTEYVAGHQRRSLVTRISPITLDDPGAPARSVARVTLLSTDVTDRRALEDRLSQTQKLEAIGTLAGGVAHDFNNLLSVIVGSCEVGLRDSPPGSAHQQRYEAILATTTRATSLTRQLLTFSRKGTSELEILSLNEVVEHACTMLERLLGEEVRIECALAPGIGNIQMNRCQLEQVLLNLSINARDAMPEGGTLSLRTRELDVGPAASLPGLRPGPHACLSVTDTGCGMDEATQKRLFEPFFTTKDVGRGTGLGLATVHGIVTRAGGLVTVTSAPGAGSTFEILLPIVRESAALRASPATAPAELPRGSETILLVEDNHEVRAVTAAMLEAQGYRVLCASSGDQALLDSAAIDAADLLFTDVVMPGLKGPELAREVSRRKASIKVLYSSGRGLDLERDLGRDSSEAFLPKPYSLAQLARSVRALLDGATG